VHVRLDGHPLIAVGALPGDLLDAKHDSRDRLGIQHALQAANISYGIHYPVPVHLQEAYRDLGYKRGDFPVTESLAEEILSLPMFPELRDDQIDYVCEQIPVLLKPVGEYHDKHRHAALDLLYQGRSCHSRHRLGKPPWHAGLPWLCATVARQRIDAQWPTDRKVARRAETFAEVASQYLVHAKMVNRSWRQARTLEDAVANLPPGQRLPLFSQ
jgi:hypothetical protein